jgi:hypothetical protein
MFLLLCRPGCVHLTVNTLLGVGEHGMLSQEGMRGAVESWIASQPAEFCAQAHTMVLQLGDCIAVVKEGRVANIVSTAAAGRLLPTLAFARPLAIAPARRPEVRMHTHVVTRGREAGRQYIRTSFSGIIRNCY